MSLTTEQLMQPRWEVIADYPGSVLNVGYVFTNANAWQESGFDPDKYPGIFKRLEWWEKRTAQEMPTYVKMNESYGLNPNYVQKPAWYEDNPYLFDDEDDSSWQNSVMQFVPATEEEYNAYQAQKK